MVFTDIHCWYLFPSNAESQTEPVADKKTLTLLLMCMIDTCSHEQGGKMEWNK